MTNISNFYQLRDMLINSNQKIEKKGVFRVLEGVHPLLKFKCRLYSSFIFCQCTRCDLQTWISLFLSYITFFNYFQQARPLNTPHAEKLKHLNTKFYERLTRKGNNFRYIGIVYITTNDRALANTTDNNIAYLLKSTCIT